ncbi:hypothetical protein QN277_004017 [Acacia crassicarpa]|uniref:Uncharacterized protein n=1 Tax=Acacia crassicarpa TaxID=499986 RepID=A0AAE1K0I9_9FABA|nr:hypothetical protein QN277_004017 [Acacia crassicarpa]
MNRNSYLRLTIIRVLYSSSLLLMFSILMHFTTYMILFFYFSFLSSVPILHRILSEQKQSSKTLSFAGFWSLHLVSVFLFSRRS